MKTSTAEIFQSPNDDRCK